MLAMKNGQGAIVSLLLGARANPVRSSRQGSSAQKYAVSAISSSSRWSKGQARRRRRFDTVMEAGMLVAGHCASDRDAEEAAKECLQAGRFSFVLPPGRVNAAQVQTLLKKSAKGRRRASSAGSPGPRCRSSPPPAASSGPASSGPARARCSFDTSIPLIERIAQRRRGNLTKNRPGGDPTTHQPQQRLETPKKRPAPGSDVSFDRSATPSLKKAPSFCMDIDASGPEDETPAKRSAMTSWRSDASPTPQGDHSPGRPQQWAARSPSLEDLVLLLSPSRSED